MYVQVLYVTPLCRCVPWLSSKYRVFVPHITQEEVAAAEKDAGSYEKLVKNLLKIIFSDVFDRDPQSVCCTQSEGRTLLDQEYLKGIRCKFIFVFCADHLRRKFSKKKGRYQAGRGEEMEGDPCPNECSYLIPQNQVQESLGLAL